MKRPFLLAGIMAATFGGLTPATAAAQEVEVRQLVIRAPEMEVVRLLQEHAENGPVLAARLWQAVREDRAQVMADMTGAIMNKPTADPASLLPGPRKLQTSIGRHLWLTTSSGQDTDRLFLQPDSTQEHLIGAKLHFDPQMFSTRDGAWVQGNWLQRFSPRDPVPVAWPTSWLTPYRMRKAWFSKETIHEPTGRPIYGWLDWRDRVESSVGTRPTLPLGRGPMLLGVLPPADQHWPAVTQNRQLEVFLAEATPATPVAGLPVSDSKVPTQQRHTLFYGIGLPTAEARALLQNREDSPTDDALLQSLLARVDAGSARLLMVAGGLQPPGETGTFTSARLHDFPTEMPSIPSAWDTRPVGTLLEIDDRFDLRHHVAPPARSEWKLDLDNKDVVMWEPRFRELTLGTHVPIKAGAFLVAATPIPRVMKGDDLAADETLLLFAKRKLEMTGLAGLWGMDPQRASSGPAFEWEAEIFIFEIPAAEATLWDPPSFDSDEDDSPRLNKLLEHQRAQGAEPLIHAMLRGFVTVQASVSLVEEYMTATEFDPPDKGGEKRMRPTALERLPVGLQVQLTAHPAKEAVPWDYDIRLTTFAPVEPTLPQTLDIAARGKEEEYGAKHHFNQWKLQEQPLFLTPGAARCLGSQPVAGGTGGTHQVAFLRLTRFSLPDSK